MIDKVSNAEIDSLLLDCCLRSVSFIEENSLFVKNWYPPPDSIISKENSSLLYFSFKLFIELFISSSVKFLFSLFF